MSSPTEAPEIVHERLRGALLARRKAGLLREPRLCDAGSADFASNDYLGLARNALFQRFVTAATRSSELTGSTGSRLLTGHSALAEKVERVAATHHNAANALLFNSGYDANAGLFACVPASTDIVIYDELIHASVHDGLRASRVKRSNIRAFSHNDLDALTRALDVAVCDMPSAIIVAVESVYSMDGDVAPLKCILDAIDRARGSSVDVALIVDEAHAAGIYGVHGAGLAATSDIAQHPALLARVVTLGKAFAVHGAIVLGSATLRQYLFNYARPLIYSTTLPPHALLSILATYAFARTDHAAKSRRELWCLRDRFRTTAQKQLPTGVLMVEGADSAIQGVIVPGNKRCMYVANFVRRRGFDVYPIRAPTVPAGSERLRIVVHAHNTQQQVDALVVALKDALVQKLPSSL